MTRRAPRMSDTESRAWLSLIAVAELLPVALDAQLRADSDLTNVEFRSLSALQQTPESTMRMGELARILSSNLPRLSKLISRLEERNFVTRETVIGDGRAVDVVLTATGRAALIRALPEHLAYIRSTIFEHLSAAEIATLADALEPLAQRLDRSGRFTCATPPPACDDVTSNGAA